MNNRRSWGRQGGLAQMTRWDEPLAPRIERLRRLAAGNMRQSLFRVRAFAMRAGLRGWDPYPVRRKR